MKNHQAKILFLTSGHSPFSARLYFRELKSLKKRYKNLSIIAPFEKELQFKQSICIIGVRKRRSRYNRILTLFDLYRNGLKNKPDVLHCHEPDSLFISLLIKKTLRNVKVIYDCHEFHPNSFTESLPSYIGKPLLKLIERIENFMASKADAVVTVNERLGKRFKKHNSYVIILPNYPPLDIFNQAKRTSEKSTANCFRFIYVGGLSANRGLFKMVKILNLIKSSIKCRLTLIGNFDTDETRQSFWRYVHKLKLANLIDYKGYLPYSETTQHLMKSDFGLCLIHGRKRYQWTEPIKVFEYSSAGLPVIVSDLKAMKKLIRESKNGIVISLHNIDQSAEKLKKYLNNTDEVRRMGERGQIAFLEKYNWEALEPRLFELYSSLT